MRRTLCWLCCEPCVPADEHGPPNEVVDTPGGKLVIVHRRCKRTIIALRHATRGVKFKPGPKAA